MAFLYCLADRSLRGIWVADSCRMEFPAVGIINTPNFIWQVFKFKFYYIFLYYNITYMRYDYVYNISICIVIVIAIGIG